MALRTGLLSQSDKLPDVRKSVQTHAAGIVGPEGFPRVIFTCGFPERLTDFCLF